MTTVSNYFRFVSARKPDDSAKILPDWKLLFALGLSLTVAIVLSYQIADPLLMQALGQGALPGVWWMGWITHAGKSDWLLVSTGSVLLFMSIYKFPNLSASHFIQWHHIFLKFYFAFTAVAFSGLLAIALKNIIGRARPVLFEDNDFWISSPFSDSYLYASFPSGHSTTMGAMIAVLFLVAPRLCLVLGPIAFLVAVSRFVIGVHFPSDVVAGLALGVIFTWIYARSFARKRLLFEFDSDGQLRLRNSAVDRARRRLRKKSQSLADLGFGLSRRAAKNRG
ncbi:MAG: phosphatase PAP2 family protein [Rhizobiaceae bacterium]|nr:phosphatase PAP2 family protein [Rhizobiaceae bacterium]